MEKGTPAYNRAKLEGLKFNRLLVLSISGVNAHGELQWNCVCDCGNEKIATSNALVSGHVKSCNCAKKTGRRKERLDLDYRTEYLTWRNMIERCYKPNVQAYKFYGGRGIEVCERWKDSFKNFIENMGRKPSSRHSIERVEVDGHYTPENCIWDTIENQMRNRRSNRWIEHEGKKLILCDWAKYLNTTMANIRNHLARGKSFGEVVTFFKLKQIK